MVIPKEKGIWLIPYAVLVAYIWRKEYWYMDEWNFRFSQAKGPQEAL